MNVVIDTQNLTKRYSRQAAPALDALNLQVERGEIFGYLGPNGAGKTTTIRLMLDFIRPTSGAVHILGLDPRTDSTQVRRQIGFLPGELRLWDHMTGRETLHYLAALRPGVDMHYALELCERLRLDLSRRAGSYSTGNKRKLGIVQAMMHRPPLLILDEPTTGLDPLVRHTFNDLLREVRDAGQTVFLSSHVLSEVQAVCDRVGVLRGGRLQRVASMDELLGTVGRTVTLYWQAQTDPIVDLAHWRTLDGVQDVLAGRGYLRLTVTGPLDAIIKRAAAYTVDDIRVESAGLEQFFMEFYDG